MRIFTDLEYLHPNMKKGLPRPTMKDLRQIVQIAAIRVDDQGVEQESFDQLVIPTYTKEFPPFFTELTNITQAEVEEHGIPFPEALEKFLDFVGDDEIWTFHKDYEVWQQNCGYINQEFPLPPFEVVKFKLPAWGIDPDQYSSGTLYQSVGLEMKGHVHNALHDVRSMSAGVHELERRNA